MNTEKSLRLETDPSGVGKIPIVDVLGIILIITDPGNQLSIFRIISFFGVYPWSGAGYCHGISVYIPGTGVCWQQDLSRLAGIRDLAVWQYGAGKIAIFVVQFRNPAL